MKASQLFTDPTYLRYIYDGLNSGKINKENLSSLPSGLVGIYQEQFSFSNIVIDRNKLLEFFSVWAILKKEVSAKFVASLLDDWTKDEVNNYIFQYSKWFNSPESGKYKIYHERFGAFILQYASNLTSLNNKVTDFLLSENDLKDSELKEEIKLYAESYIGDHLAISAYYKTEDDHYYEQLIKIEEILKSKKWSSSNLNRLRWNYVSAQLASIEADQRFLKKIIKSQNEILNAEIKFNELLNEAILQNFLPIEEILRIHEEDEKYYILLKLIIEILEKFFRNSSPLNSEEKSHVSRTSEYLVSKINSLNVSEMWLCNLDIIERINHDFIAVFGSEITLISKNACPPSQKNNLISCFTIGSHKVHGVDFDFNSENILNSIYRDYKNLSPVDFKYPFKKMDDPELVKTIKFLIEEFVRKNLIPIYQGEMDILSSFLERTNKISLLNSQTYSEIYDLLGGIRNELALSTSSDLNYDFNIVASNVLELLLMRSDCFLEFNWLDVFVSKNFFADAVKYFNLLCSAIHKPDFDFELLLKSNWSSKKSFIHVALSGLAIQSEKKNLNYENVLKVIQHYLNFNVSHSNLRNISLLSKKVFNEEDFSFLTHSFETLDFVHFKSLSFLYSKKLKFLELISKLRFDEIYLSGVEVNKYWAKEILEGLIDQMGWQSAQSYLLEGLEEYVQVMGTYGWEEYDRESNRPKDNVWKIEWWVMGNFIQAFQEIVHDFLMNTSL
ncbi:MAG: hypothetical protein ACK5AY_01840, partial [Bacteroidota bacterium]